MSRISVGNTTSSDVISSLPENTHSPSSLTLDHARSFSQEASIVCHTCFRASYRRLLCDKNTIRRMHLRIRQKLVCAEKTQKLRSPNNIRRGPPMFPEPCCRPHPSSLIIRPLRIPNASQVPFQLSLFLKRRKPRHLSSLVLLPHFTHELWNYTA